ncbi:hypothetical protein HOLleu_03246 [Holothuria leucospilota]|uniref:Uncharacterized protein n=1 Tax=Holothuria leucospilota TaxID=206669 RepID=A0A9Q1CT81_HOLLE|nr:hypothetical protein HOLleu_03246 [Holothuria leucospilota]
MLQSPDSCYLNILINIPDKEPKKVDTAEINSGQYRLEVLGGNHTRLALQTMQGRIWSSITAKIEKPTNNERKKLKDTLSDMFRLLVRIAFELAMSRIQYTEIVKASQRLQNYTKVHYF